MRKIFIFNLISAFIFSFIAPGWAESENKETLTKSLWVGALSKIGVSEGGALSGSEYGNLIKKLESFPAIADKIQRSAGRPVQFDEWVRIVSGMGIQPKPDMTEGDWKVILAQAGVQGAVSAESGLAQSQDEAQANNGETALPSDGQAHELANALSAPNAPVASPSAQNQPNISQSPQSSQASQPLQDGKPVTLDLRGMDVVEVLKMLSRQSGINIAASPNVRGNVTIMLKDVNLWDALRMILETNDLAYVQEKGMVRVLTAADYEKLYGNRFDDKTVVEVLALKNIQAAPAGKFLEYAKSRVGKIIVYEMNNSVILMDTPDAIAKMKKMLESMDQPQETRVFDINYAKGDDILPRLKEIGSKDIGEIDFDRRANRIVVKDSPDKIQLMEALVKAFDSQHRAVLIEAKIMQITLNDKFQMGVNWEHLFNSKIQDILAPGGVKANFNVLPTGSLGIAANLGTLAQNNFTAMIQALETVGKTNLLSSPRIAALNNESAKILVGTKEAYVTTTVTTPGSGGPVQTAEQVNFVDVGVKLFVTPSVGADGYVTLKIRPEVSSVERTISTAQGNAIPIVRTSESEASIVAKDGETVMIGGLIEDRSERSDSRIPILGSIPLLGIPFRSRTTTKSKTEIVIFLTPKIISGDAIKNATTVPAPATDPEKKS